MKNQGTVLCKKIGLAVRRRRESLGMSQEQLSFGAKLHRNYISRVECGTANPSVKALVGIAAALKVEVTELLG